MTNTQKFTQLIESGDIELAIQLMLGSGKYNNTQIVNFIIKKVNVKNLIDNLRYSNYTFKLIDTFIIEHGSNFSISWGRPQYKFKNVTRNENIITGFTVKKSFKKRVIYHTTQYIHDYIKSIKNEG